MKKSIKSLLIIWLTGHCLCGYAQQTPESLGWKLSAHSYTFKEFTLTEALPKVSSLGLKYMELGAMAVIGGDIEGNCLPFMDDNKRESLLRLFGKHGIKILSYSATGRDESEWKAIFKFAKQMGVQIITCEPKSEHLDMVEQLANEYEINVAIHNHPKPRSYWDPEMVTEALEGRGKRMGACPDIGHWIRSGIDPVEALRKLEGKIINIHFKDLNQAGIREAHDVIWGTGVLNMEAVLRELKRQNYKGPITIEYEYNWKNSVPDIQQSLHNFTSITETL